MAATYGARLRAARKAAGLTQKELGRLVGQASTTIANLEQGNSRNSTRTAALARALGVRPEWLEDGYGSMTAAGTPPAPAIPPVSARIQPGAFTLDDIQLAARIAALPTSKRAAILAMLAAFETTEPA